MILMVCKSTYIKKTIYSEDGFIYFIVKLFANAKCFGFFIKLVSSE